MKKNKNLIDKIFLIILSLQTFAMGIAFTVQACLIYFRDKAPSEQTYTRELVGEKLLEILPVIIIWLVMVVINAIYFTINKRKEKNTYRMTNEAKLKLTSQYMKCPSNGDLSLENDLKKEEKHRFIAKLINLGVLVICSIMGLLYLVNPNHFVKADGINATDRVISMTFYLMPWVIIAFISMIATMFYLEFSNKKSIEIVKAIIKSNGRGTRSYIENKKLKIAKLVTTYSLLAVAIIFIIVGVFDGSCQNVLIKACKICQECIGLG